MTFAILRISSLFRNAEYFYILESGINENWSNFRCARVGPWVMPNGQWLFYIPSQKRCLFTTIPFTLLLN